MLFKRRYHVVCHKSQEEVMGAVRTACQCRREQGKEKLRFQGRLHSHGFVLWRGVDVLNMFSPKVCGSFSKDEHGRCTVGLTMRLHRWHSWLMFLTYLCWAICLATLMLLAHHAELLWVVAVLPLPLLVLGIMAFRIDSRRRARKLMRMVRGQLSQPA